MCQEFASRLERHTRRVENVSRRRLKCSEYVKVHLKYHFPRNENTVKITWFWSDYINQCDHCLCFVSVFVIHSLGGRGFTALYYSVLSNFVYNARSHSDTYQIRYQLIYLFPFPRLFRCTLNKIHSVPTRARLKIVHSAGWRAPIVTTKTTGG